MTFPTSDTDTNFSKLIKAILISGTFNLPARCLISDTVQFNGKYGCIKCLQQRESHKTEKGGNVVFTHSILKILKDQLGMGGVLDNMLFKHIMKKNCLVANIQPGYMVYSLTI